MKELKITYESQIYRIPFGKKPEAFITELLGYNPDARNYEENPVVGILLNNEPLSLSTPVENNGKLTPIHLFSELGKRMYRHSLCFLITLASSQVFPERELIIGHSLGDGFYYTFADGKTVTEVDAQKLEKRMSELITAAKPIERHIFSYDEALTIFQQKNMKGTALLLAYKNSPRIPLYQCDDFIDISYEPLLHTTRLLDRFQIRAYGDTGFLLRYPRQSDLLNIGNFEDSPMLYSIFKEYKEWGAILDIDCVGKLNQMCDRKKIHHFIQVAEALHDKKISRIAEQISESASNIKTILIAGPSSSGKTTFTKRLGIQLRVLGFDPIEISLDDYYLPKHLAPLDDQGRPDLEALHALDIKQLNEDLTQLISGQTIELPKFDFQIGKRVPSGKLLKLEKSSILVMEGIHGLNPDLTPSIPKSNVFRIYVSALTQLNLDDHNRISTTDNRIIRRTVRDYFFRNMNAEDTLKMWDSVHAGEKKNIFPFQNNADAVFNSALDYELSVLKIFAEPLLKTIKPSSSVYAQAVRLLTFIENFSPIPPDAVPKYSILREFIGNSGFSYD